MRLRRKPVEEVEFYVQPPKAISRQVYPMTVTRVTTRGRRVVRQELLTHDGRWIEVGEGALIPAECWLGLAEAPDRWLGRRQ